MNRSFLTSTIFPKILLKLSLILSPILFCTPSHTATSCIQNKISGLYESDKASNKNSDNACLTKELFTSKEQSSVINQTLIQPQNHLIYSVTENTPLEEKITRTTWNLLTEDGSVYAALKRWSTLAKWQISWEIPVDFPIEIIDSSTGSFENSVRRVLAALHVSDYPPHPCFYENNVVRVVRRIQGNDDECK